MRLKRQGILYLIADRKLGDEKILEALAAGVDLVQLREKNVTSARYLEDALWLKEQAKRAGALFLVNDRLDIALLSGADGVHLGQEDVPVDAAKRLAAECGRPDFIVGATAKTKEQAMEALKAYPGGLQIGGGITAENAMEYLNEGASHVIVTSYVFSEGSFRKENLEKLVHTVGKKRLVLDLSCRKKDDGYYVVTDRWQKFTGVKVTPETLDKLAGYCDEFLIHGVDVEGKGSGMESELVRMLGRWEGIPVTYAGGIGSLSDLEAFRRVSGGKVDFTIGSALDLFGGTIPYSHVKNLLN